MGRVGLALVAVMWCTAIPWVLRHNRIAALDALGRRQAPVSNRRASACEARVVSQAPLIVDSGRTVTIDISSTARSGSEFMFAGTPTLVWAAPGARDARTHPLDSAFGVIWSVGGRATRVPIPRINSTPWYPRATQAGPGRWSVVFFTGIEGASSNPIQFDSATIWYAEFDGTWRNIERIGGFESAFLRKGIASDLLRDSVGDLYFAFPVGRESNQRIPTKSVHGVVMLSRRNRAWHFDTLRTWDTPNYVQVTPRRPDRGVSVVIAQDYFRNQVSFPTALFLADYDAKWSEPQLVASDTMRALSAPQVIWTGRRRALAWRAFNPADSEALIQAKWLGSKNDRSAAIHIASGRTIDGFAGMSVGGDGVLWLSRDGNSSVSLRPTVQRDETPRRLDAIAAPFDNFVPVLVPIDTSSAVLITGRLNAPLAMPPAASYITRLEVDCSSPGP